MKGDDETYILEVQFMQALNYSDELVKELYKNDQRYELIDGVIYLMSPVKKTHAEVCGNLHREFSTYLKNKPCKIFLEPYAVYFDSKINKKSTFVMPDIFVVCDSKKTTEKGCLGAPDLVIEILSSNLKHDTVRKFALYERNQVQEYWIIDAYHQSVNVFLYNKETGKYNEEIQYLADFDETITPAIFPDLEIKMADIFSE